MNHFRLPFVDEKGKTTALNGNAATLALIRMVLDESSIIKYLEAQIYGGAYNHRVPPHDIGYENVMAAQKFLSRKGE